MQQPVAKPDSKPQSANKPGQKKLSKGELSLLRAEHAKDLSKIRDAQKLLIHSVLNNESLRGIDLPNVFIASNSNRFSFSRH